MTDLKRTVLVTGCSDGSLGSALAIALNEYGGFHIFATARQASHMTSLKDKGIETLELDVTSGTSIQALVERISPVTGGTLDVLINSVGGGHYMPFWHLDIAKAKALFDVNVWGFVAVTQAFLPLLKKNASTEQKGHKSIIINNTSISSVLRTP